MTTATIIKTGEPMPQGGTLDAIRSFLFGSVTGLREADTKAWRRFWKKIVDLEPGEFFELEITFPRSGPFHRRHMKIESAVFDAQERFEHFEQFRYWLKVGSGWVDWAAGPKGGVVPIPRSISYSKADEMEFREFHSAAMSFLRGPHAANYLWKHLGPVGASEMMDEILVRFGE